MPCDRIRQCPRLHVQATRTVDNQTQCGSAFTIGLLENARIVEQITALLIGFNIRHKGHSGLRITGLPPEAYDV